MPRHGRVESRQIEPDPIYGSELAARFINKLMQHGKKEKARKIFYEAMEQVGGRTGNEPLEVFDRAVRNAMPVLEVRPRRVGGSTYQVPMEVRPQRRVSLALRWMAEAARSRGERTMIERVTAEIVDASNGAGGAVRRREDIHRMAEANKAFAHYRW